MPRSVGKSGLAGKLGATGRKAVTAHKADQTTYGAGADLPGGIEGGIAQLTECKFDKYKSGDNTGEYYFLAAGIVKQPAESSGVPIQGLRTQIMEPVCDTPTRSRPDVDAHLEWVLNEMRKLGVDTGGAGIDDLEDMAAAIKEEQPHFRFRTWQGQKQTEGPYAGREPLVNHDWRGACEYQDDGDEQDDVVDKTDGTDDDTVATDDVPTTVDDLDSLAKAADGGDDDAQAQLANRATVLDIDHEAHESWTSVASAIVEANGDTESGEEEDEDDGSEDPQKGEVYQFKPPRARKAVECEVTAVFAGKQTCNLKNLADGKIYKAVAWDKLLDA